MNKVNGKKPVLPQKFSEFFKLKRFDGSEYDFLDIYAYQDISLFLDPYGISAMGTKWSRECEEQIATYFQYLIDSIKDGDRKNTTRLLNALHEVDEIGLGYSSEGTSGRGIGPIQAKDIQEAFETSQAAKSGDIKDIADCALLIPGINRDKISDITANILKKKLVEYTQKQCKLHSIPTERVAINNVFDYDKFDFISYFDQLPVIKGKAKILLPISSVRRTPSLSKDKFYRNFVLEFLKAEHQHAGDSLATILKNGRVVVRIGDLKKKYPMSTDLIYKFSKTHPQILERYKSELKRTPVIKELPMLKTKQKVLTAAERRRLLLDIKVGNLDAGRFHKMAYDNFVYIFGNRISNPRLEEKINDGRKRIDIVFDNDDKEGFFAKLNSLYHVKCPKIIVECKNYGKEIGNPEIDQLKGRLNPNRGRFGLLVCRAINDKADLIQRCKDALRDNGDYIIVLDDTDMAILMEFRNNDENEKIDDFMLRKLDKLIM